MSRQETEHLSLNKGSAEHETVFHTKNEVRWDSIRVEYFFSGQNCNYMAAYELYSDLPHKWWDNNSSLHTHKLPLGSVFICRNAGSHNKTKYIKCNRSSHKMKSIVQIWSPNVEITALPNALKSMTYSGSHSFTKNVHFGIYQTIQIMTNPKSYFAITGL